MPAPRLRRRPRSARTRGAVACTAALATLASLTGCGGPVEVDEPSVDEAARGACEDLLGRVPYELGGERPRETDPSDVLGGAWGDPAMVLRCGVEMPDEFDQFSPCNEIEGVGWFAPDDQLEDTDGDLTVTTIGWEPVVELRIPAAYRPPNDVLLQLAGPIKRSLTLVQPCV